MSDTNKWRSDTERAELVERIIHLDRDNQLLRRTVKELVEAAAGDEPFGVYLLALQARIGMLEENIERLIAKGHRAA